jgi:quercetin dioxygenase-like cupin family protein
MTPNENILRQALLCQALAMEYGISKESTTRSAPERLHFDRDTSSEGMMKRILGAALFIFFLVSGFEGQQPPPDLVLFNGKVFTSNAAQAYGGSGASFAQMNPVDIHEHGAVPCVESTTPGERPLNTECAILMKKKFSSLPPGPLVWRFENFPTTKAAQDAGTPASAVVEVAGKVWLLTLAAKGGRSKGGMLVAETELLPAIPPGPSYEIVVGEADLGPEANVMTHKHSGPETWYLLSGEQCLELPDRAVRARVGETMSAPAETPMKLNIVGPGKRDALFLIVHDSSKPFNTFLDWQPKGLCQK